MRLVFVTQEVDERHPVLAQTVDLVRALALRATSVDVVARRHSAEVPPNVVVRTFDAATKAGRTFAFERALLASKGDAVLVHMVPQFALLARWRREPLLLWYTHWNASRALRLATRVVDVALSVDASSYPVASPKLRAIGHAIDVQRFDAPPPAAHDGPLRLLALGRTARWKGLGTLLGALELVEEDVHLEIRGPSLTPDEHAHRAELALRIRERGLSAELLDPVPREEIPTLLAQADVVVSPNEPHAGSTLDKAVFEAAACARPVISTNPGFAPLLDGTGLPLIAPPREPRALADAIAAVASAGAASRARAGEILRARVVAEHSLDHWADAVLRVVREVRSARGTAGSARQAGG